MENLDNYADSQVDLEKGVITLKKGEDIKSFDLKNKDDVSSLLKLSQRGWYYDKEAQQELGQLRTRVKNIDALFANAKKSDEGFELLKKEIEFLVGKPLSAKEEAALQKQQDDKVLIDDEENDRLNKVLNPLFEKIKGLEQSLKTFQQSNKDSEQKRIEAEIDKEASKLEEKYNGLGKDGKPDGSPKFERQAVFKFASEKQITDLDLAFRMLNFDKLTEYAKTKAVKELKEQQENRENGFVESGDDKANLPEPKKGKLKPNQKTSATLKYMQNKGLSLFTE